MRTLPRRRPAREDDGFTLIELLVVIIIIGILAAVAIPVFLNQRAKGYDAQAKSDLRELANFEELYLNDFSRYGTIAEIQAGEPQINISPGVTVTVVAYNAALSYCISAKHQNSSQTWFYDNAGGGLQPTGSAGCSTTTSGTAGGSLTG